MSKLCECGCGEPAPLAPRTDRQKGWVKGEPKRFALYHHSRGRSPVNKGIPRPDQRGPGNPNWRGGRLLQPNGYVWVLAPGSPMAGRNGYALEHRLVMAQKLGRELAEGEVVHHLNGDKADNRPGNLELLPSQSEHARRHAAERRAA